MIGMFDSGVGGLSVARSLRALMPTVDLAYLADSAWFPYGEKSPEALVERTSGVVRFLLEQGARLIVVACNSASGAAIVELRRRFALPFVGVEPAVKVAADAGARRVGVLCTGVTAGAGRYHALVERVAGGMEVITAPSAELAGLVERGEQDSAAGRALVASELAPLLEAKVDALALGCTHYAFLGPLVTELSGLPVLEPSAAVARQAKRLYEALQPPARPGSGHSLLFTTGDVHALGAFVERHGIHATALAAVADFGPLGGSGG